MKALFWVGRSREELKAFPAEVRGEAGHALFLAQMGGKHLDAKPLRGFGGAGVVEVISDFRGDTFRVVYTVTFPNAVYVLHAFQKKSRRGIETDRRTIELVRRRLAVAVESHAEMTRAAKDES